MRAPCGSVKVYTTVNAVDAWRFTASSDATGGAWADRACMIWQIGGDIHLSFTLYRARLLSQVDSSSSIIIITVCFSLNVSIFSRISQSNLCIMITILTFTDKFVKTLFFLSCMCLNVRLFFKNVIYWPYTCQQEGKNSDRAAPEIQSEHHLT